MSDQQMRILCGVKHASTLDPNDDELIAVLAIRSDGTAQPGPIVATMPSTEIGGRDITDWLFSAQGSVTQCAVTTGYDVTQGKLQARVTLSCALDLSEELDLSDGQVAEQLLHTAISKIGRAS